MSKKYIELVTETVGAVIVSDTAEKDLFMEIYSELKSGDDYDTIVGNIKEAVPEMVVQRQLIMIVNMARDYVGSKLFTRLLEMRWYNVKALVQLIRYINKEHGADTVKAVKGKISRCGKTALGTANYNNELATLVNKLKADYKVVITDDGQVLTKSVNAVFAGLTDAQKTLMLKLLLDEQKEDDNKEEK